MIYVIYFMRGDKYEIEANSEMEAFRKLWKEHPHTQTFDLLKVTDKKGKEVFK